MQELEKILGFGKEIVMKYGTKSLVASLGMYFIYELAKQGLCTPYASIGIVLIAVSFFFFKHLQEINQTK